ncbi:50S ribosomal protein L23 [Limihaloglobus sulfuriphilus]|uniref:Large ribosomal subunit protein uL23 n=1 Tax=Limihaloglobus sulfuriphilus TaxID=1851148 RepID=A0A1Q2MHB9_9BACT|nr:50S ribosomal protein L23 [Limihaloglobus sulfuriphilus]AQQ72054.1 50S ribosomal protein L23 [Limihaloglobus sulfuriphilus]
MDNSNIIVRPVITEQSMHFANTRNAYAFKVNTKANKIQIKNAVEKLYDVKVIDVRTMNYKGKPRRRGRNFGRTDMWKKAVVVLSENHRIDLY